MRLLLMVSVLGANLCAQDAQGYDALKIKATLELRAGKLEAALKIAEPLSRRAPDDIDVWYTLAQTYRRLGKIEEAEKATQWMLDLRPEYLGGLHEAGLLREVFNDLPGALDLLNTVFRATAVTQYTDRAATLGDIARIFDKQNLKTDAAQLRKEVERLKGLEIANAKATATPDHK